MTEAPLSAADLRRSPNPLAPHYSRFRVDDPGRILLTGHSHQAWPDRGFEGQQQAWLDAARLVDDKWDAAFERAERVRRGYAHLLEDDEGAITLAGSTHDLLVRWLSALPLSERPRLVTTTGEFHTIRRQLDRLAEAGLDVVRVPHQPADAIADRIAAAVDERTAAALVSSVLFEDARIVPGLERVATACARVGAELLVDAYHHLNVLPFSLAGMGLEGAFVTGGGYKYCQLGEGNAFLRAPPRHGLRPVVTGWFAEFSVVVEGAHGSGPDVFAGATYDPTSHYRASEVLDFQDELGLTPELLRQVSRHQVGLLAERFDALDLDPAVITRDRDVALEAIGGFLALRSRRAGEISGRLRERGVWTDYRGERLRLGPAPYLTDAALESAVEALGEVVAMRPAR